MAIAMFVEATLTYTMLEGPPPPHKPADDTQMLATFLGVILLFVTAFSVSWGVVAWIAAAELAPLKYHAPAVALATSVNWSCNALVAVFGSAVSHTIAFASFGVACTLAAGYVHQLVPETSCVSTPPHPTPRPDPT